MTDTTLDLELLQQRSRKLYDKIQNDIETAKAQYQGGNAQTAQLLIDLAKVDSNILVAERLDLIARLMIRDAT